MVNKENISTIKLSKDTKSRLEKLKIHKKDSYEEALQRIISILNILKSNPYQAATRLRNIEAIRDKIKATERIMKVPKPSLKFSNPQPNPQRL